MDAALRWENTLDKWTVTPALAKVFKASAGAIKADLTGDGGTMLSKDTFDNSC